MQYALEIVDSTTRFLQELWGEGDLGPIARPVLEGEPQKATGRVAISREVRREEEEEGGEGGNRLSSSSCEHGRKDLEQSCT